MKCSREIALDTETTGLNPEQGHRIIEIGCVELVNGIPTNRHFHTYVNPMRDVPDEAFGIHGISTEFLLDKPSFADIYEPMMEFIGDAHLVIHNAAFDLKFLRAECKRIGRVFVAESEVTDTLLLARKRFPGAKANLDALCTRFGISATHRSKHGALIDAELLALVYIEMMGGAQRDMLAPVKTTNNSTKSGKTQSYHNASSIRSNEKRPSRNFPLSVEEIEKHRDFLRKLKYPLWTAAEESFS